MKNYIKTFEQFVNESLITESAWTGKQQKRS